MTGLALACAALLFLIPNRYTAETEVLPPKLEGPRSALLSELGDLLPLLGISESGKNPADYYARILRSRTIADSLIGKFDLQRVYRKKTLSETEEELAARSQFLSTKFASIRISVEDRDPRRAAALANEYVAQLQTLLSALSVSEARYRVSFYGRQLQMARENLISAEVRLRSAQQSTGMMSPAVQARFTIEAIAEARHAIALKQAQLQAMQSVKTNRNPEVEQAREEIAALEQQLAAIERSPSSEGEALQPPLAAMPEVDLEYLRRYRDVRYYETVYDSVARQHEAAKLDESKGGTKLQVLDRAAEPDIRSSPDRMSLALLLVLCGFSGSVTYLSLRELARGNA